MSGPIVFPTDFSTASDSGLEQATRLARQAGVKLVIVHVAEPPLAYGGGELYYGIPEPNEQALAKMLERVRPTDPSVACEHHLVRGEPAHEIVRLAEQVKAAMIVMGTHGRTGLMRLLMGSVAEAVVRRASCPVLIFKPPEEAREKAAAARG